METKMKECDDHCSAFAPRVHPDSKKKQETHMPDHKRGAAHPQHHTPGQMRSQMNPDHGPHTGAGKHV